jgi:hypothetical protein
MRIGSLESTRARCGIALLQRARLTEVVDRQERRGGTCSGRKVVDFTTVVAGLMCRRLQGDLGADVIFIENLHPGVVDRLGLGLASPQATNPSLIYASINNVGDTLAARSPGDLRDGDAIQCLVGFMPVQGGEDEAGAPRLGEYTATSSSRSFGYSPTDIERLRATGCVR